MPPRITAINHQYALPQDTQQTALIESARCLNLGLLLDKYQPWGYCTYKDQKQRWDLCFNYKV